MKKHIITALRISAFALLASLASAASLKNSDIVKMVEAKLDPSIILSAVKGSDGSFDTSAEGIIALAKAGVPSSVIDAMMKKGATPASSAASSAPTAAVNADQMKPSEVVMIDGAESKTMQYLNPQTRTAARGLGFGGVASYSVLRGAAASLRTKNASPAFLVAVPNQAQADSYFTLASFAVRKNASREIMIGGGYMSYSTGIHPDRVMAVKSEKHADQTRAPKDFTIYKITPEKPLAAGEYAVIIYSGEMQGLVGSWFSGTGNAYFDFGVE
jgi:hypothetical protein